MDWVSHHQKSWLHLYPFTFNVHKSSLTEAGRNLWELLAKALPECWITATSHLECPTDMHRAANYCRESENSQFCCKDCFCTDTRSQTLGGLALVHENRESEAAKSIKSTLPGWRQELTEVWIPKRNGILNLRAKPCCHTPTALKTAIKISCARITRCLERSIMALHFCQVRAVFKQMEHNLFTLSLLRISLPAPFASCMIFYVKMPMC